jgi:hypothetical protein
MASACSALAASDEETLKGLLRAAWMAHAAQEAEKGKAQAADVVDTGCGSGQDPNEKEECSG